MRTCFGLALLLTGLSPVALTAAGIDPPARSSRLVDEWIEDLERAHEFLLAAKPEKASRLVEKTREKVVDNLIGGEVAPELLGRICFLRALLAAGEGNSTRASWDYNAAAEFVPDYDRVSLTRYGAAGTLLDGVRQARRRLREWEAATEPNRTLPEGSELTEPRKIHSPAPLVPRGHNVACSRARIVVQVILDKTGVPTKPEIVGASDPVLTFASLEALRDWRFEPGRLAGEPVEVYYNLTVNFHARQSCPALPPPPAPRHRFPLG